MTKSKEAKSNLPAVMPGLLPSTEVVDYGEHAGAGMDVSLDELLIPFVGLLQKDSKQCVEGEAKFIDGAEAGMIINKATNQLFPGGTGLVLVPVLRTHTIEEWVPLDAGGGHVATHGLRDDIVEDARARARAAGDNSRYPKLVTEEGNELVETYSLFCIHASDEGEPLGFIVVPFTSSKISRYKAFRTAIDTLKGARKMALYSFVARLTSFDDKNKKGRFKNFTLAPVTGDAASSRIGPDNPLFQAAVSLKEAIESGRAKADFSTETREGPGGEEFTDEEF